MHSFTTVIVGLVTFNLISLIECQSCSPYDTLGAGHTMCKYAANSGCPKMVRGVTQTAINEILATHNALRQKVAKGLQANQPGATNMKQMKWNTELSTIAQRWVDQCTFGHDTNRNTKTFSWVGQNVAILWSSANTNSIANFKDHAINPWYNEVSKFNNANIQPFQFTSETGHYTQVVWADSGEIGCGYAYYLKDGMYTKLYACNYGPGGNILSTSMYKKGTACTACTNGCSTTYPGLCNN